MGWFTGAQEYGAARARARWAHVNGYLFYGERGERFDGDAETAARALRERWWVREYERWFDVERPAAIAENERLQSVDLAALSDAELAGHTRAALRHALDVGPLHFAHRGREASRDALRAAAEREGVEYERLRDAFGGGSPATSRPAHLVSGIASALRAGGVDPTSLKALDDVRSVPRAAELLDAYLQEFGHRLLDSYDLACPTLIERPEVVLASIRAAGHAREQIAPLAVELPPMSPELRQLFDEARLSAGTEDDDDGVCIFWPLGILRHALLEVARRRRMDDPAAVFEVDVDELGDLLAGGGPSDEVLVDRLRTRRLAADLTPPAQLGGVPAPWSSEGAAGAPSTELSGVGIGTDVVRGRACVVRGLDSDGLASIEPGDVLIAVTTTPGYNAVMPIIAAMATETHMGHTVISARELGIPTVVGVAGLLDAVKHGATVEVDAANGRVRVLD